MIKKYIPLLILLLFFVSAKSFSQDVNQDGTGIEGLSLYPNPVSGGKLYISSLSNDEKEIVIYNLLGKIVLQTKINTKELNVSSVDSGTYIIKITENGHTTTRKLIVD
jgi:hypothetical protein